MTEEGVKGEREVVFGTVGDIHNKLIVSLPIIVWSLEESQAWVKLLGRKQWTWRKCPGGEWWLESEESEDGLGDNCLMSSRGTYQES